MTDLNKATPSASSRFIKILAGLTITFLAFLALLPTLLSTSWGKERILGFVNNKIPGHIETSSISLGWFGPQQLDNMVLNDPQGTQVLSFDHLKIDSSLFTLLFKPINSAFYIQNLNVTATTDSNGVSNLEYSLKNDCCKPHLTGLSPATISLKNVQARFNQSTLHATGETQQNDLKGNFNVDAELLGITFDQLVKQQGDLENIKKQYPNAELKGNVEIINFPVGLIDQFIALQSPELSGIFSQTIGQQLNVTIKQKATSQGVTFSLRTQSQNMIASTEATISEKTIRLVVPLDIKLNLSPLAFEKVALAAKMGDVKLKSNAKLHIVINNLNFPISSLQNFRDLNLSQLALEAVVDLKQASLLIPDQKELSIESLHADIETAAGSNTANLNITSEASQDGQPMRMQFEILLPKPSNLKDLEKSFRQQLTLEAKLTKFPAQLLDEHFHANGLLLNSLGNHFDAVLSIHPYENKSQTSLQLTSEKVNIPQLSFLIDDTIQLQNSAAIALIITPTLLTSFNPDLQIHLQNDVTASFNIHNISLPISALFSQDHDRLHNIAFRADLSFTPITITNLPTIGTTTFKNVAINIHASPLSKTWLSFSAAASQPDNTGTLSYLLGKETTIAAKSSFGITLEGISNIADFEVKLNSDLLNMQLTGEVRDGNRFVLTAPAMMSYTLTAASLQSMGITTDNYLFAHKAPLELTISTSHIPLSMKDISRLYVSGDIKINDLVLSYKNSSSVPLASLDDMKARWTIDGGNKLITLDFNGTTKLEQQAAGKLSGAILLENWVHNGAIDFKNLGMRLNTSIQNLPTAMLGVLLDQQELIQIVGSSLGMNMRGYFNFLPHPKGNLEFSLNSSHINGNGSFILDNSLQINDEPAEFNFKLSPQGYTALRRWINPAYASDFVLNETSNATLKIKSLSVDPSHLFNAGLVADLEIDKLSGLDNKSKQTLVLNKIKGNITSQDVSQKVTFDMSAQGFTGQSSASAWNIVGSIDKALLSNGSINKQDSSVLIDGNIDNLPVPLLCHLICKPNLGRQVEAVLGANINAKVRAQLQSMNGPVYVDIKGTNGQLLVDAQLYKGNITLRNDIKAEVTVTPQLGIYVLSEFLPVMNGIISSDKPLKLTIAKQGFTIPIKNIDISNIFVGRGTLELGKVSFTNKSQIAKVLSLLTPANAEQIHVWTTPAYFSLSNGVVKLERIDLLINERYPIASWGTADISNDRLNMVIGLSGMAISKAFGVSGISKGYMLQLPLKGTLNGASIDKTKAAGRLSALVAQSQGGPQGLVLGTVLDIATGGMTEPKVPKPSTDPLPWGNMIEETEATKEQQSLPNKVVTPIEEIGKGAGALIKKLFK